MIKKEFSIPKELEEFYESIGYGFFFHVDNESFDRLLDVISLKKINLREDYFEYDPDLELYDAPKYSDKLIFFEVNEGVYLLIQKDAKDGKNAIYYFNEKIADSFGRIL